MPSKDSRLTDAEIAWINATFANNDVALKTIRKIFLYEIEPENPIHMARDMWTTLDLKDLSPEDRVLAVTARQMLITHLEGGLSVLKTIAGENNETPEQIKARLSKNSSK